MKTLKDYRNNLNVIDQEMTNLFKERMLIIKEIAKYKKYNNIAVIDVKREQETINSNLSLLNNKELESYYLQYLTTILNISKEYQNKIILKGE